MKLSRNYASATDPIEKQLNNYTKCERRMRTTQNMKHDMNGIGFQSVKLNILV